MSRDDHANIFPNKPSDAAIHAMEKRVVRTVEGLPPEIEQSLVQFGSDPRNEITIVEADSLRDYIDYLQARLDAAEQRAERLEQIVNEVNEIVELAAGRRISPTTAQELLAVLAEQEKEQRCDFGSCVYPKGHKGGHRFESEAYTP